MRNLVPFAVLISLSDRQTPPARCCASRSRAPTTNRRRLLPRRKSAVVLPSSSLSCSIFKSRRSPEPRGSRQRDPAHVFVHPQPSNRLRRLANEGVAIAAARPGKVSGLLLLEHLLALGADRRQRDDEEQQERGDQQAEADRPLHEDQGIAA